MGAVIAGWGLRRGGFGRGLRGGEGGGEGGGGCKRGLDGVDGVDMVDGVEEERKGRERGAGFPWEGGWLSVRRGRGEAWVFFFFGAVMGERRGCMCVYVRPRKWSGFDRAVL